MCLLLPRYLSTPSFPPSAESTAPEDLIVIDITNTSATFRWSPPEDANGIIISYNITLQISITDALILNSTVSEMSLDFRFTSLQPFFNYTVTIFAINGFGGGASASHDFMTVTGSKLMHIHVGLNIGNA